MRITGGKYNSREVKAAEYENIKPCLAKIRQGIFNVLSGMTEFEGAVFFDMFAGSGIMSLEAASRGFHPVMFERDKKTALAAKALFKSFGLEPELYFGDAVKNIQKTAVQADVIYIDPPYASNLYDEALKAAREGNKLKTGGIIVLEHPKGKAINMQGYETLKIKEYGDKQITYLTQRARGRY